MKKFMIIGLVYFAVVNQSLPIAFAASPPKEMMTEVINTPVGISYGKFGELVDCVKGMGNNVKWEKINNGWIMKTQNTDVMTKKINKGSWMFVHGASEDQINRLYLNRLIINNKEYNPRVILDSSQFVSCWKNENVNYEEKRKKELADTDERIRKIEKEAGIIENEVN
jgi:hypothetical protein